MSAWYGSLGMARLHLRVAWRSLLLWPLVLTIAVVASARSLQAAYPTLADRLTYAQTLGSSPATMAFNGRGYDLTTIGGITSYEVGMMGLLLFPIVALVLAIGRTRSEEETGRNELLTAGVMGRLAPLGAALAVVTGSLLLFGLACTLGLIALGLPVVGSCWYVASLVAFSISFAAIGMLAAQLAQTARTAYSVGLAVTFAMFVIRAFIDGQQWAARWATPMNWLAEVRPWGKLNLLPMAGFAALTVGGLAAAVAVAVRRDLSAGVIAPRPGRARASRWLRTPLALNGRLTRTTFASWAVGLIAWGVGLGLLSHQMVDLINSNPSLQQMLGGLDPQQIFASLAASLGTLGAIALGLQTAGVLGGEESSGRLGMVLATGMSRRRVWAGWLVTVCGQAAIVHLLGAASLGISMGLTSGRGEDFRLGVDIAWAYLAPVLLVAVVAVALRAFAPRLAVLAWLVFGWMMVVSWLGDALRLPTWARHLSPLEWVGRVPLEQPRLLPITIMAAVTALLAVASLTVFTRRDLRAG